MLPTSLKPPVPLFCGYHTQDRAFYEALAKQLSPLVHKGDLEIQDGGHVPAGNEIESTIEDALTRAQVIVLLVSDDFTSDDRWWRVLDRAVEAKGKGARLVPVRVSYVSLDDTPLARIQLLPRDPPVAMDALPRAEQKKEWSKIADEIRLIVKEIQKSAAAEPDEGAVAHGDITSLLEDVQSQKNNAYELMYRGRGTDALSKLRGALKKLEVFTQNDSESLALTEERAHLNDRIGQCEYAQGRFDAAREAFDLAFRVRTVLCAKGGDGEARHDVMTSHFWRAHLAFIRGDLTQARDEQQAGMRVCEALLAQDPDDLKAARAFVVLQTDLGTTQWELGDQAEAEKHLRESLDRVMHLAKRHPENRQLQRDVSVGLFRLADFLAARGESEPAARLCEESIRICRALTEWDPRNVQWRRHLATARMSMGDVRLLQNDMVRARGDYEFAAGTMGAVAAQELENLVGQRQYAISERKLGELADKAGDHRESIEAYKRAVAAMEPAASQGASKRWDRELDELRNALESARAAAAKPGGA